MTSNIITIGGHSVVPVTLQQAVDHYLQRKRLRGASINTLLAYGGDLADFVEFAALQGVELVGLVGERLVDRWLDRLGQRGLSPRSQARKLVVLRQLVQHCNREGWLHHDPTKDSDIRFVTLPQIAPEREPLLAMLDSLPTRTPMQLRDRAMMRLMLDGALRVSDATRLDLPGTVYRPRNCLEIVPDGGNLHLVGKGGKPAVVPVNQRSVDWVSQWLQVRHRMAGEREVALFVSNRGTRMTRQQAYNRIRALGAAAGIAHLNPQLLRHRRVGDVVQTLGLEAGQQLARHAKKSTTANVYGAQAAAVVRHVLREYADLDGVRRVG
jgi:site-specific recombinase XerC